MTASNKYSAKFDAKTNIAFWPTASREADDYVL